MNKRWRDDKMKDRYKEYGSVIIATFLHGFFTYEFLGSMPHISLDTFRGTSIKAFFLWLIYSIVLYLVVQKWMLNGEKLVKYCLFSLIFGVISAVLKGFIDLGIGRMGAFFKDVIKIACMVQVTTIFFGIFLMYILFIWVAKRKVCFELKRMKAPICGLLVVLICYGTIIANYLYQNQKIIQDYQLSEEEVWKLNYYLGSKIMDSNVWFYVAFYIIFWWFMRRLTEKTEER